MSRSVMLIGVISLLIGFFNTGQVVEAGVPNAAEPQVAVLCEPGASYHPQYSGSGGRWTADLTAKPRNSATCMKDKMEILDYCKKVYPHHDITNIVEASHYVKVGGWCRLGSPNANKCKTTRWVKPFRCLEGPFQSDALLVPESCLFDHIHNQSRCWQFGRWNATAGRACAQRGLRLRTFAMLLPCGISLFSGVEFVCCPKHFKADGIKMHKPLEGGAAASLAGSDDNLLAAAAAAVDERPDTDLDADLDDIDDDDSLNLADDDDLTDDDTDDEDSSSSRDDPAAMDDEDDVDDEDDYDDAAMDDDDAWDDAAAAAAAPSTPASTAAPSPTPAAPTTRSTTPPATADPYFTHFDPRAEHQSFKDAQQRLEETHREKVTKVMKDWSELEERYQDMVSADPKAAQSFRQKMTARFQAEVQSLEEEGLAEKRRMAALHQQRVLSHLATRRRTALTCYTRALADLPPNTHRVQKCLQRLVRALSAERAGALGAWRRAAAAGREAAAAERPRARDRLADADRALQKAMQQLKRKTNLYNKIGTIMEDYIQAMQSKEDGMAGVSLSSMTPDAEEALLTRVEADARRARNEREHARQQMHQAEEKRTKQRDDVQQERIRTEAVLGVKTVSEEEDDDEDLDLETSSSTVRISSTAAPTPSAVPSPAASTPDLTSAPTIAPSTTDAVADVSTPSTTNKYSSSSNTASDWSTVAAGAVLGAIADAVTVDTGALQAALEQAEAETEAARSRPAPPAPPAHSRRHDIGHSQAGFTSVDLHGGSGTVGGLGKAGTLYPVLCVGAAALVGAAAVALAVARRRTATSPQAQGFVEVEQTAGAVGGTGAPTPEERHVANMQINGYENPTYKYFEVKE